MQAVDLNVQSKFAKITTSKRNRVALSLAALIVLGVVAIAFPHYANGFQLFVVTEIAIFSVACLGLTVAIGWSGQTVLAQTGFFGIGAYGTNYLFAHHVPWLISGLVIAIGCAVLGLIVGLPAARLKGFYLAIATLAFAELIDQVYNDATPVTGGANGTAVHIITIFHINPASALWYMSIFLLVASALVVRQFGRTRIGRCLRAVRDADIATSSLGLSSAQWKVIAFMISAVLGSLAGTLYGQALTFLSPDAFSFDLIIEFLVVVFIGGVDRIWGAIIGASFFVLIQEALQSFGFYQRLIFGVTLLLVVRFLPGGIVSIVPRVRAYLKNRRDQQLSREPNVVPAGVEQA